MSVRAQCWAWDKKPGGLKEKLVLIKLADHADNDGWCWPSHKVIAEKCDMSERSVVRAISKLKALGFLSVKMRKDSKGQRTSNLYKLDIDDEYTKNDSSPSDSLSHGEREVGQKDKNLSDNLSLRENTFEELNVNDGAISSESSEGHEDKNLSDNLSLDPPETRHNEFQPQNLASQSDRLSGFHVTTCPNPCDSLSPKPSLEPSKSNHHHQNQNQNFRSGGGGEKFFAEVFDKLGFYPDEISHKETQSMIKILIDRRVTPRSVKAGFDLAVSRNAGVRPVHPHYCKNFILSAHNEALARSEKQKTSEEAGENRWQRAGFATEGEFEAFKQAQAMRMMKEAQKRSQELRANRAEKPRRSQNAS